MGKGTSSNPGQYQQTGSAASQSIYPNGGQGGGTPTWEKYALAPFGMAGSQASGKKNAPPPPNYMAAAEAQGQSGQQSINAQTQANRPNQQTGFGSETWTQGPNGQWTQITSLNPTLSGALGGLQNQAATNAATGPQSMAQDRQQAINANYNQATSRLNPQWQQASQLNASQLANQGLDPTSAAYRAQMQQFNQAQNDAYGSAMNNAIGMGNQTEAMDLQAMMSPYQQMGALQGFQNGMPGFNAAGAWQPTQYLPAAEAAGGYGLSAQQMNNQQAQGMWNDAAQLGQVAASDERLKKNIERLDVDAAPGIPLATFEWKHDPGATHLGVIAQDVEKVSPQHVHTGPDGIKRVDYSALKPFALK